jgi:hypothetical protein
VHVDPFFVANLVVGGLLLTTIGFAIAWTRARERAIRAELSRGPISRDAETRFDQLQHTLEAVAIEVERVSEAQRYTARLLAEQRGSGAERTRLSGQVNTPH